VHLFANLYTTNTVTTARLSAHAFCEIKSLVGRRLENAVQTVSILLVLFACVLRLHFHFVWLQCLCAFKHAEGATCIH